TRTFVSFHRQRLLLHPVLPSLSTPLYNAPSSYAVDLISNALGVDGRAAQATGNMLALGYSNVRDFPVPRLRRKPRFGIKVP
ncbi:hypothetical protein, partial [Paraburkholderia sp. EG304]|uniref:hypothetical protein n=1 Tax=Paraburkholderia sp. EG304 TaxID=3237015 RepID=UPI00397875BC